MQWEAARLNSGYWVGEAPSIYLEPSDNLAGNREDRGRIIVGSSVYIALEKE